MPVILHLHKFSTMNFYRCLLLLPSSLLCILLFAGCASAPRPMVDTWLNSSFSPTPTNSIALQPVANARPVDIATGKLLADEMQREGFVLVPADHADYLLSYVVSENVEEHVVSENSQAQALPPSTPSPQDVAQPGVVYSVSSVQKSYYVRVRDIRLFLYTNPKTNPAGLQLAWQGTITIGKGMSAKGEQAELQTLLHYFGTEHNGTVDPAP